MLVVVSFSFTYNNIVLFLRQFAEGSSGNVVYMNQYNCDAINIIIRK